MYWGLYDGFGFWYDDGLWVVDIVWCEEYGVVVGDDSDDVVECY